MRLVVIGTILSIGIGAGAFPYPESVPLHRRQYPGTPEPDCHTNCGCVIVANRVDGHCASDTFKAESNNCLDCVLKYEICQYCGDSVSKAATACGLEANPVEAASAVAGTTSATSESILADHGASKGSVAISSTKATTAASLTARSPSQVAPLPHSTAKSNLTLAEALPFESGMPSESVSWSLLNTIAGVLVAAMFW